MTIGPPTVGKTTLKEQLLPNSKCKFKKKKRQSVRAVKHRPPSTPVCESVMKIEVTLNDNKQSYSTFTVDNYTWKSLTPDEEFIARLKGLSSKDVIDSDDIIMPLSVLVMIMYIIIVVAPLADIYKQERMLISEDNDNIQVLRTLAFMLLLVGGLLGIFFGFFFGLKGQCSQWIKSTKGISAETVARESLERNDIQKIQPELDQNFNIYFRDCGGQPEFHEVLPALVSHSTLFIFVFNLTGGLDNRYKVTYKTSDGNVSVPYESSFTVKEALLQCLASISSIGKYFKPSTTKIESIVKLLSEKITHFFKESLELPISKVIIIGTHKDELLLKGETEDKILLINDQLEDELKGTDWYSQDMVIPTESGMVLLGINSFNSNDIKLVKSMVIDVALNGDYQVKIPVPWLALDFCIRKLEKKVMSLKDCQDLALNCNISLGDEFHAALWFLHNKVGTIRYFNIIPELKDVVITDPQVLFDIVTDIIVNTFSFGKRIHRKSEHDRFRLSGRFTKYHLEQCKVVKETLLSVEQVIAVLEHLVIIAPVGINESNEQEYFLPCVLVHASLPSTPLSQNDGYITSLLITFKCHYTPRGIFSSLIAKILLDGKDKWELSSEEIFRDQIEFNLVKSGHIVTITNFFRFLEIVVKSPRGFSTISDENVYVSVKHYISCCLSYVKNRLNYTATAEHFFGFYCKGHKNSSIEDHPAICNNNNSPKYTTCSHKRSLTAYLLPQEQLWFNEKSEFALCIDL